MSISNMNVQDAYDDIQRTLKNATSKYLGSTINNTLVNSIETSIKNDMDTFVMSDLLANYQIGPTYTTTAGTLNVPLTFQSPVSASFFSITLSGIGSGWTLLLLETDPKVFKDYIRRMAGKVLMCEEHIEEETIVVQKYNALRYIYLGLGGKFPNTDVNAIDEMEISDEIHHVYFKEASTPKEYKEALVYDTVELDNFISEQVSLANEIN